MRTTQDEQRGGQEGALDDGGETLALGPGGPEVVDLVEAHPIPAGAPDQTEDEGGRGTPPEPVIAQRVLASDEVETAGADLDVDRNRRCSAAEEGHDVAATGEGPDLAVGGLPRRDERDTADTVASRVGLARRGGARIRLAGDDPER